MKNLLFFTAAALLLVESTVAYAIGDSVFTRTDTWSGGERFPPKLRQALVAITSGCESQRTTVTQSTRPAKCADDFQRSHSFIRQYSRG